MKHLIIAGGPSVQLEVFFTSDGTIERTALSISTDGEFTLKVNGAATIPPLLIEWMRGYAAKDPALPLLPLQWANITPFQGKVYTVLAQIPMGKSSNYSLVAKSIGQPKAPRAVGNACGQNPFPLIIPCHRVLAANGKIGGFSCGLNIKRELLAFEKLTIN